MRAMSELSTRSDVKNSPSGSSRQLVAIRGILPHFLLLLCISIAMRGTKFRTQVKE